MGCISCMFWQILILFGGIISAILGAWVWRYWAKITRAYAGFVKRLKNKDKEIKEGYTKQITKQKEKKEK